MRTPAVEHDEATAQRGHSGAEWRRPLSLHLRLSILVALIVGAVVTALAYLEINAFRRATERDLLEAVRLTAHAVADDLRARPGPPDDVAEALHELMEANAAVRALSIVRLDDAQRPELADSTSSEETTEALQLARAAITGREARLERSGMVARAAEPFSLGGRPAAVVATVSLDGVRQATARARTIAWWFAVPTILIVTLLIDLVMRFLVHQPLHAIHHTMHRAAQGDLTARAPALRRDELGVVAAGLNDMLGRIERFNEELQDQIRDATEELQRRNAEIGESYQRTLALREALARKERMAAVGQVAATVAHQVGTPLNLISGYIQMMREDLDRDPHMAERLAIIEARIQQVTRILRTLLDEARQPAPRKLTTIAEMAERVREIANPRLASAGVTLAISIEDNLEPISADPVQLELAMLNLVSNALDAMPQGGTLTIRGMSTPAGVRVEIADTGGGVPAELLHRIFEPWVTTKPIGHGTGLGLGIVREVVEAHGGTISVRNDPNGGAVFSIDLPRASRELSASA